LSFFFSFFCERSFSVWKTTSSQECSTFPPVNGPSPGPLPGPERQTFLSFFGHLLMFALRLRPLHFKFLNLFFSSLPTSDFSLKSSKFLLYSSIPAHSRRLTHINIPVSFLMLYSTFDGCLSAFDDSSVPYPLGVEEITAVSPLQGWHPPLSPSFSSFFLARGSFS